MKVFRNTNEYFGEPGPFESDSKEALATEMQSTFDVWADEESRNDEWWDGERNTFDRDAWMANCRAEFIAALEEVTP